MEQGEYQNIYQQEDTHWWYQSLHRLVLGLIKPLKNKDSFLTKLLDAGCGTGGMFTRLKDEEPAIKCVGLDISAEALKYCRKRGLDNLVQSSVEYMPFADQTFNLIISLDVLYHLQVGEDVKALMEIHRVMSRGGYAILQLPAYEFLRGAHDEIVHTRQRYTRVKVCEKMEKSGFTVIKCSYRNMFLFPLIYIKRFFGFRRNDKLKKSDLKPVPVYLNNILKFICLCENRLLKYFNLPFGSSILCLVKKT